MKLLGTVIGSAICGGMAFGLWPEMWKSYGIMGGWTAAAVVISICWYMNHWLGTISNPDGTIWIDQGCGVGTAGVTWALVRFFPGCRLLDGLPTLCCCFIGGALAGVVAAYVKKSHPAFASSETSNQQD